MASRFDNNAINLQQINNPQPPSNSNETKVFVDSDGKLKKIGFNGRIEEVAPEVNLVSAEAEISEDGYEYKIVIPSPTKAIEDLQKLISNKHQISMDRIEFVYREFEGIMSTIRKESTAGDLELENNLQNLEDQFFETLSVIQRVLEERITNVSSQIETVTDDLQRIISNITDIVNSKASVLALERGLESILNRMPAVISGSDNVTIERDGNDYKVIVSVPEVTREVVREIERTGSAGGISKKKVEKLIQEALEGFVGGKEITSNDGSVTIVEDATTIDLSVDTSGITGQAFTPLAGEGMIITPVGFNYEFSVDDWISGSEVASVSGDLQSQIDSIVIPDVSGFITTTEVDVISSNLQTQIDNIQTGGSDAILIGGNGIEVVEGPTDTWTISVSGDFATNTDLNNLELRVDDLESNPIPDIFRSEVASISGDLSNRIDNIVEEGTTIDSPLNTISVVQDDLHFDLDVVDYISGTEVALISSNLQTQIDNIPGGTPVTISSSGASIIVTQDGQDFNLEVASAPIQDHNDLNGLQGGSTGEYYHLSESQFNDYIGSSEVASISAGLDGRLDTIEGDYLVSSDLDPYITSVEVAGLTGDLQSQIDSIVIPDVSGFITTTEVAAISAGLDSRITAIESDYVTATDLNNLDSSLTTLIADTSANLQSQIDAIEGESTVIESSGGSILVSQDGNTWNLEVASAPIQDHNDLNGLQGGSTGEYYHLSEAQFNDYIGSSQVAGLTGDLQSQIDSIVIPDVSSFITTTEVASISSGLDSRITAIESDYVVSSDLDDYTLLSVTQSISSNLQSQIDAIEEESTQIVGGSGIEVVESPTHTWTINVTGDFATNTDLNDLEVRVDDLESQPVPDIFRSEVALISGDLQSQIDAIEEEQTVLIGGNGIEVVESPTHTWTISVTGDFATNTDLSTLDGRVTDLESNPIPDIFRSEVESISSNLDSRITAIESDYVISSDLDGFINTVEVAGISGNLQSQIDSKQDTITLVAGTNVTIDESPANTWTISAEVSGGGGGSSSGIQGRLALNNTDTVYTITHPAINTAEEFPVVSLDIPASGNTLYVVGIFDRQPESFKVELSGIPNTNYGLLWHISTQSTLLDNSTLSVFEPFVIQTTPELVNITGSQYYAEIQQSYGNLIAVDADVGTYAEIEVRISSEWTTSQVGTFRLDLDVKSGQTFTFDNSIEGINDVTLPDVSGAASLLFDKPYGTTTWYVRQSI